MNIKHFRCLLLLNQESRLYNPTSTKGISFIWNFIKCRRFKKDWKGHEVAFEERLLKCLGYFSLRWIQKYPKPKATFYGKLSTRREIKHLQKHGNIIMLIIKSRPKCQSILFKAPLLKQLISSSNRKDWFFFCDNFWIMSNHRFATFPLKINRLFAECKSQVEWSLTPCFFPVLFLSVLFPTVILLIHLFKIQIGFSNEERELNLKSILHTVTLILFWAVIYEMHDIFW